MTYRPAPFLRIAVHVSFAVFCCVGRAAFAAPPNLPPATTAPESTYQTSRGLRFADEGTFETELGLADSLEQETKVLQRFGAFYGLTFSFDHAEPSRAVRGQATWHYLASADAWKLKRYGGLFIDEWSKYPRAWIVTTGIRRVAFVMDLAVSGQPRYAMPDPYGKTLYLQVPRYKSQDDSETDNDYYRGVIHHEFDHCIEYDLFDSFGRDDPDWTRHNAANFHYGNGGITAYTGPFVNSAHPRSGFVDAYAMTAIEEDKAEIYAYLFTTERYKALNVWIRTDSELAGKVAEYKNLIRQRVPTMDDAYFAAINPASGAIQSPSVRFIRSFLNMQ